MDNKEEINKYMKHYESIYKFRYTPHKSYYDKSKPITYKINLKDLDYLNKIAINSLIKKEKRLNDIKLRLQKDIIKNVYEKNYQFNSFEEYISIKKYIETELKAKYHFDMKNSTSSKNINLCKNKLKTIYSSEAGDYPSDDEKIEFVNEKIPIIYGFFNKSLNCIDQQV